MEETVDKDIEKKLIYTMFSSPRNRLRREEYLMKVMLKYLHKNKMPKKTYTISDKVYLYFDYGMRLDIEFIKNHIHFPKERNYDNMGEIFSVNECGVKNTSGDMYIKPFYFEDKIIKK